MPNSQELQKKLTQAYHQLLKNTKEVLDVTKKESTPAFLDAIDKAKEATAELAELTVEEIDKVSDYVVRDLHDAAEYIAEGERELGDWLRIDALLIEDKFLEVFSQMVDHTQVALDEIAANAKRASEWHTGEITSAGTLVCSECGKVLHFHDAGHIPPCPKCHASVFHRAEDKPTENDD